MEILENMNHILILKLDVIPELDNEVIVSEAVYEQFRYPLYGEYFYAS